MLDLYQDQTNENLAQLKPVQDVEPGIFANFFSGAGSLTMQGLAKVGRAASMGAFGAVSGLLNPVLSPGTFPGTTVARDTFFKWHDDVFNRAVERWTPNPNEVGLAGEIVGSLIPTLMTILAGPAGPAAAVATTQLGTAEDLARKYPDVSATKANLVGAVQGAGLGFGIWMPILGQTLAQRVLVGGAGFNVLQGAAMRGVSGAILSDTKAANDFKALEGKALTIDFLLGMAFGGGTHLIPSQRQQGAEAWKKIDAWAKTLKPSEIDALMVLREGQHINEDSLPGKPATGADLSVHVDRMRQAINDLASDKPVDVEHIKAYRETYGDINQVQVRPAEAGADTTVLQGMSRGGPEATAAQVRGIEPMGETQVELSNGIQGLPETGQIGEAALQNLRESGQSNAPRELPRTQTGDMDVRPMSQGVPQALLVEPQFTPDPARLAEAERQAAHLQTEAERVRLEEGLPKPVTPETRPPNDITPLDPVAQARAVGQHIERALLQAGMDTKEAVANAVVWEAFVKSAHERYGVPPAELMAKWGVDVRRMDSADKLLGALEQRYAQADKPIPTETPAFKNWFGGSAVTAEGGAPLRVYHGAKRLDRMGPKIDPKRATSGPMPYFTDSTDIASKYSTSKADTSLALEDATNYEKWFRIKVPGYRKPVDLDRAWFSLSPEQKAVIAERAPQIAKSDDGSEIVLEHGNTRGTGGYDQHIKEARGNHLKALMEEWLTSGNLYNDEAEFLKVLKMAGMDMAKVEMHDPWAEYPGVLPVYLAIKNPLRTEEVTPELIAKLEQAVKRTRRATNETGDMWDKNRQSPKEWVEMLKGDLTKGDNSYVWTSIPDRITAELKALGFDGIIDRGGKGGGMGHTVYIPFAPGQVKSAIGNRGTFDPNNPNILYQSASTRVPFAIGKDLENHIDNRLQIGLDTFKGAQKSFDTAIKLLTSYVNWRPNPKLRGAESRAEKFIDDAKNNLLWLYDQVPAETRARSKLWYEGANRIAGLLSSRHPVTPAQASAIIAVHSPQTEWFTNVSRAERVMDIWFGKQDAAWSPEMSTTASRILAKPQYAEDLAAITGKTLRDLDGDPWLQAMWMRVFDESHNPKVFREVKPEGAWGDFLKNDNGSDASFSWASFGHIAKSIEIIKDGSPGNISNALGGAHKVRSFYNNIFDPGAAHGDVTIDTHAVAAALLRPLSGNDTEVTHNLGAGVGNAQYGIKGTYGIFAEAYRRAATERGVLPRELQSITWEAVRGLYTDVFKRSAKASEVEGVWKQYKAGDINEAQVRGKILEIAGGIDEPNWHRSDSSPPTKTWTSSYGGELADFQLSRQPAGSGSGRDIAGSKGRRKGSKTLYQSEVEQPGRPGPTWYSELARQVDYLKMSAAPGKGWKDTIKGLASKGVIKPAEIEATGLNEWLDLQEGKVTKQQVQDFIANNGVKVEEVTLGDDKPETRTPLTHAEATDILARNPSAFIEGPYGGRFHADRIHLGTSTDQYFLVEGGKSESTKFSQYQLPGGENYRELLLTLPIKREAGNMLPFNEWLPKQPWYQTWKSKGADDFEAKRLYSEWSLRELNGRDASSFQSSHFDQPNILAHIRFNERTDADGKRVLFIEEIQSDWAQKGKKEGFRDDAAKDLPDGYSLKGGGSNWWVEDAAGKMVNPFKRPSREEAIGEAIHGRSTADTLDRNTRAGSNIPSAPFVGKTEAWVALSMKRMIRYAAENGFDRVAWTNGEQQAARYDLSKQVDYIDYNREGPDTFRMAIVAKGGDSVNLPKETFTASELENYVGKDIAQKIINGEGQPGGGRMTLRGPDLKVGGEGMKAFYDKIIPNVANDVLKKLGGGKVGEVTIPIAHTFGERGNRRADQEISDFLQESKESKQPGFDITPAMLEKVMSGMPLFQGGTRGAVNFEIGKTIIALFEKADKTTFQHETGHVFLEMTKDLASRADAPVAAMQDWATIADWLKIEGGTITREAHEQWARGWEKYLAEGVAPNEGLKAAFRRFRDWIIEVYKSLTNIDAPLNNQIRGVMARMLESQAKDPIAKGGLEDPRLQQPEFRKALEEMGRDAGWAEIGGSILRERAGWEAEGEPNRGAVVGRSEWIPRAEWYERMQASAANMPGVGGKSVRDAVRKALMGEKMTAGEKRAVTWMMDEHVTVMKHWDEVHGADANPAGDPFEIANTQHAEGIEPTKANTLDMTLIDRAREVAPDAFEAIPTNYDDAQYMAAVREIVDANKPRTQEVDQSGGQDAQGQGQAPETAQNGSVVPRAQAGGGDLPPPLTDAGETSGGSAGTNMVQNEARRFAAENPEIKMVVGTDDQGNPVRKSLNEILDDAALETELAMRDVELFQVAAECLMGIA
tara:strand:- start:3776 stop:10798 length:7023 start_codon:yes stop_codon:yes gene_type:complete